MPQEIFYTSNSKLQSLKASVLGEGVRFFIKRDDLIHPLVSGNKWRKLEFAVTKALLENKTHLVSYGGAYSNHMVALAAAGAAMGFKTTCFVRGDEIENVTNHYLALAKLNGMELIPVARDKYRNAKEELFNTYFGNNPECKMIPEGGESVDAFIGIAAIIGELKLSPDFILHASATTTTAIGLAKGLREHAHRFTNTKILAVAVLKNVLEQETKVKENGVSDLVTVVDGFQSGGYAKANPELMSFLKAFIKETGIMIDPVYTAKALFAMKEMIASGQIPQGSTVLFLHTGGTLGIFSDRFLSVL